MATADYLLPQEPAGSRPATARDEQYQGRRGRLPRGTGIEQCGYRDEIAWRTPDETETSYFELPADGHIQVVEIRRITFDQNGSRVRLTVTIWRADRNQFVINVGEVPPTARDQA